MVPILLGTVYLIAAGIELAFTDGCIAFFERVMSDRKRVRAAALPLLAVGLLFYISDPTRIEWFTLFMAFIYTGGGLLFALKPDAISSVFEKGYVRASYEDKRRVIYTDCFMRTLIGLLLFYAA